ncbi:MAG: hypothetical protein ACYCXW_09115 [Solirubrobacteraceae bacterium]
MQDDHDKPPMSRFRHPPSRTRSLAFGLGSVALAILAALTASWVPFTILAVIAVVFIGRGITTGRQQPEPDS